MLQRFASIVTGAVVALSLAQSAHAGQRCQPPDEAGNEYCEVGIPSERLEPISAQQKMSQWCWAASISMLFGYHGHPVSQERIVESVWGELTDMPAMNGGMMSDSLARPWTDDRGRPFRARVRVYDGNAGQYGVDEQTVIDELVAERPLLVGTVGHAMVLTAMRYVRSPGGGLQILGATVRDPWPGRGRRELDWHEMEPQYVATVEIPGSSQSTQKAPRPEVAPPRIDNDAARVCERSCAAAARSCQEAVPQAEACLQERVEACVSECAYDYDQPEWTCRAQLCDPRGGPNRIWRAECQGERAAATQMCREELAACRERCE